MDNSLQIPLHPNPTAQQRLLGQVFTNTHTHTHTHTHSVGLLWTSDQPVTETSTWQYTKLTTDRHPCPGGIQTHNPSKRAATYPRLRPHGHWGWLITDDFQLDFHIHHKAGLHNTVLDLVRTTLWQSAIIISRSLFSVEIFLWWLTDMNVVEWRDIMRDLSHWSPEIISNNFSSK
jgi:hypothetical protein